MITDVGSVTPSVVRSLQGCEALLLECNHDAALLQASNYPYSLKRRILGSHGHLSNDSAAELLTQCLHAGLKQVVAAHLSERNNTPDLAAAAVAGVLGIPLGEVSIASQSEGIGWLML